MEAHRAAGPVTPELQGLGADQQLMYTLHFQDSQVARVSVEGGDLHIALSAAAVSGTGNAGNSTSGYLAPVRIVLQQANWQGELGYSLGRLSDGELSAQGAGVVLRQRKLALPCSLDEVQLWLAFANGTVLQISADALHCSITGHERYTESYAC